MTEQWRQLKETITEIRNNNQFEKEDVTLMCRFLLNYMGILENEQKEQIRWIPVSERLPEPNRKDEAGNDIAFLVQTEWGTFFTATYDGNWCYVDSSTLVESDVIAWMSLPKPYEPQERSDEE